MEVNLKFKTEFWKGNLEEALLYYGYNEQILCFSCQKGSVSNSGWADPSECRQLNSPKENFPSPKYTRSSTYGSNSLPMQAYLPHWKQLYNFYLLSWTWTN